MNPSVLYYQNPLGTLTYNPLGLVTLTWSAAPITADQLPSLYAHTLQALHHHDACKLLTNQIARQPLPVDAQTWIVEKWIPQALAECAYSHCAIVKSAQEASRQAARAVGSRLRVGLVFHYFQEETEAIEWLASV